MLQSVTFLVFNHSFGGRLYSCRQSQSMNKGSIQTIQQLAIDAYIAIVCKDAIIHVAVSNDVHLLFQLQEHNNLNNEIH